MTTPIETKTFSGVVKSRTTRNNPVGPVIYNYVITVDGTCKDVKLVSQEDAEVGGKVSFTETTGPKGTLVGGLARSF